MRTGVMVIYIDREEVRRREAGQTTKVDGEVVENEVETKDRSVRIEGYKWRSLDVKLRECLFAL